MASLYRSFDAMLGAIGRRPFMSSKSFQYMAGPVCGALSAILFLISLIPAHQFPPIKPYYTPEQTVEFWKEHETGTKWGAAIMLISGTFYLPFTAVISAQMRRIPNLHYSVSALQLAAGSVGLLAFTLPAMVLALIPFRLDRNPDITQMLTDLFFFTLLMPWPSFIAQNFAFAYAILIDQRPRPLWPKFMAVVNVLAPVLFLPTTGIHCTKIGAFAWNSVLAFWDGGLIFVLQVLVDSLCLFFTIRSEPDQIKKVDDEEADGTQQVI